jgi:hypothetical protein
MEGTFVKKLAIVASAATALLCAAALVAAPAEAKTKHHKKPAAAPVVTVSNAGPSPNGYIGPTKSAGMCWGGYDTRGFGFWQACPK